MFVICDTLRPSKVCKPRRVSMRFTGEYQTAPNDVRHRIALAGAPQLLGSGTRHIILAPRISAPKKDIRSQYSLGKTNLFLASQPAASKSAQRGNLFRPFSFSGKPWCVSSPPVRTSGRISNFAVRLISVSGCSAARKACLACVCGMCFFGVLVMHNDTVLMFFFF